MKPSASTMRLGRGRCSVGIDRRRVAACGGGALAMTVDGSVRLWPGVPAVAS